MKNKLYRLFKDNFGVAGSFRAEVSGNEATLYLYDAIGAWYGVEASDFVKELAGLNVETIHIRINSPGGDVFDARAIATAIKSTKAETIAHIDGVCASAVTWIATSCDKVEMADGAFFMIHNSWTIAIGNADEMLQTADLLTKIDDSIVADYAKKTGLKADEIKALMDAETWFTADEAKEKGFADSVFDGAVENTWNVDVYQNAPDKLKNRKPPEGDQYPRDLYERRAALFEATV